MSLLEILPQPRKVTLAGHEYRVSPLRIVDLAKIQAFIEDCIPHPYEGHREAIFASEGRERKKAVMRVQLQVQRADYPPVYPSTFTDVLFATVIGGSFFYSMILGRDNSIAAEDVDRIVADVTPEERTALDNVLWGVTTAREFELMLNPPIVVSGGKPIDFCETFARIGEKYRMTPDQIGQLTVDQFRVYRDGKGRPKVVGADWTMLTPEERQRQHHENLEIKAEIEAEGQ